MKIKTAATSLVQAILLALLVMAAAPSLAAETFGDTAATPTVATSEADQPTPATTAQDDSGVRFDNRSRDTQFVLATFDGEQCGEMEAEEQLEIAPGESATVDSGESRVCWCATTLGKIGDCTSWSKAKAGKKVTLR